MPVPRENTGITSQHCRRHIIAVAVHSAAFCCSASLTFFMQPNNSQEIGDKLKEPTSERTGDKFYPPSCINKDDCEWILSLPAYSQTGCNV